MPRSIRIPDDLWHNALAAARDNDETLTAVVVRALDRYVKRNAR